MQNDRYANFRTYKRRELPISVNRVPAHQTGNIPTLQPSIKPKIVGTPKHEKVAYVPFVQNHTPEIKKPVHLTSAEIAQKTKEKNFKEFWHMLFTPKYMLPTMAASLFLIGLGVSLQGFYTNKQAVEAQTQQASPADSAAQVAQDEKPDEAKPDPKTYGSYSVAPDLPRYVRINKIGLASMVQQVGIKPNGELKSPNNIYNVGWYEKSAKPGDAGGATLLDAHVHGPTKPGAFYKLKNVSNGDIIEVERGDGQRINYKVVSKESVPTSQVDMAKALVSADTSKAGLNLITCDGNYNSSSGGYENRLVVYAIRI